jgi:hypothetical protein
MTGASLSPAKERENANPEPRSIYQQIPPWFVALFAVAYMTGYVIEFLYYASLGIVDAGGDIFKLKYVQTGITFLFSCTLIGALVLTWLIGVPRRRVQLKDDPPEPGLHITRAVLMPVIFSITSIYVFVLFTPPIRPPFKLIGITGIVFAYFALAVIFFATEKHYREKYTAIATKASASFSKDQRIKIWKIWRRVMLLRDIFIVILSFGLVMLSAVVALSGRASALRDFIVQGAWVFLLLAILLPIILYMVSMRSGETKHREGGKSAEFSQFVLLYSLSGVLLFLLAVVMLLTYSYWIFPFIPSVKGGADYEIAARVTVVLKSAASDRTQLSPTELENAVLLYSTSSSYYFAKPGRENTACDWRAGRAIPKITEVRRDEVSAIVFRADLKTSNCEQFESLAH